MWVTANKTCQDFALQEDWHKNLNLVYLPSPNRYLITYLEIRGKQLKLQWSTNVASKIFYPNNFSVHLNFAILVIFFIKPSSQDHETLASNLPVCNCCERWKTYVNKLKY